MCGITTHVFLEKVDATGSREKLGVKLAFYSFH